MKLTKLQLENFRNYRRFELIFDEKKNCTVIVGPNGKGKTNLLEAIYVLSIGKSFRTTMNDDMIDWEMDYLRCQGEIFVDDEKNTLEVFYSNAKRSEASLSSKRFCASKNTIFPRKQKVLKRNDLKLKHSEFIGNLLTVLFHPEDLNMLYLSPSLRRRYLDILLSQTDRSYLKALFSYKKVLKQRNALLQEIRENQTQVLMDDLCAWDKELIIFGTEIIEKRKVLVKFFDRKIEKIYQEISGGKEKISMEYKCKIIKNDQICYEDELFNRKQRDIACGETTAGPHRDDLEFFINGKEISATASRGEFRTLLLAMKIAEIEYIKEKTGQDPVLLLDDVFSELDNSRRKQLISAIKTCQTIITATDINSLGGLEKDENVRIVKVE